jgi:hypothetical protein
MSAVLPHYKQGPANYQVSTLIFGGQLVEPTTQPSAGATTTDLTVKPTAATTTFCLGVAAKDANVIAAQTGAPNTYGQPQIDISLLDDYTSVYYGGVDIWCWYSGAAAPGAMLVCGANGTLLTVGANVFGTVVGRCTHPGGVGTAMLTQQIGGLGSSAFFLGRARIF